MSPGTMPVTEAVRGGLGWLRGRVALLTTMVRGAGVMARVVEKVTGG